MKAKKRFVKDLLVGEEVDDLFSVKFKKPPRQYSKGFMFEARVSDRTGQINVKFWGSSNEEEVKKAYELVKMDEVLRVRGLVSEYREVLEIGVSADKGGMLSPVAQTEYRIEDFVGSSSKDIAQMMTALDSFISQVEDPMLKSLLSSFFSNDDFVERFRSAPASISIHANWIGGLLEHTLNVLQICDLYSRIYPGMDRDLLLAGAVLHDIGKVEEYRTTTSIDETVDGMLRGHLTIGAEMVTKACDSIPGFPENLKLKLAHMVLSHHCRPEFGSPKAPMFPEAMAVYLADDADSRIEQYVRAKEEAQTEDLFVYSKRLGSIYLG